MWMTIFNIALQLLDWILSHNRENKEMAELYFKHIEKQQREYMNSTKMRDDAKARMKALSEMPFVPSP